MKWEGEMRRIKEEIGTDLKIEMEKTKEEMEKWKINWEKKKEEIIKMEKVKVHEEMDYQG